MMRQDWTPVDDQFGELFFRKSMKEIEESPLFDRYRSLDIEGFLSYCKGLLLMGSDPVAAIAEFRTANRSHDDFLKYYSCMMLDAISISWDRPVEYGE